MPGCFVFFIITDILLFVLKIFGIMDLIVISDKDGVHIIQLIDQIHALFIAQKEAVM